MDLHRVVTAAGDITKPLPEQSIIEFLEHANSDFEKTNLTPGEKKLREQLKRLRKKIPINKDPLVSVR